MQKTPVEVSVKAVYSACCSVATKAKELLESKKTNVSAHASVLFEYRKNEFSDVESTYDANGYLRIKSDPNVLFEGRADDGKTFVESERTAAAELSERLGLCPKDDALKVIDAYVEGMRS